MTTQITPNEAARHAIRLLGGPSKAARLLKVKNASHQTVQSWLKYRVPAEYCPEIEAQTRALGQVVPCELLRPDVRWSALRVPVTKGKGGVDECINEVSTPAPAPSISTTTGS
jgi:DNA-binding transcriptional regulator YdaS (Cro superfamily)